jgi:hypothetical protein
MRGVWGDCRGDGDDDGVATDIGYTVSEQMEGDGGLCSDRIGDLLGYEAEHKMLQFSRRLDFPFTN